MNVRVTVVVLCILALRYADSSPASRPMSAGFGSSSPRNPQRISGIDNRRMDSLMCGYAQSYGANINLG